MVWEHWLWKADEFGLLWTWRNRTSDTLRHDRVDQYDTYRPKNEILYIKYDKFEDFKNELIDMTSANIKIEEKEIVMLFKN